MTLLFVCTVCCFFCPNSGRGAAGDFGADVQSKPTIIGAAALTPEREETRLEEAIRCCFLLVILVQCLGFANSSSYLHMETFK